LNRDLVSTIDKQTVLMVIGAMSDTSMRERPVRIRRAGGLAFDLTVSKLLNPLVRPGTIRRASLLDRLAGGDKRRVVSVVAPPGYGKTTLLAQWAESGGTPFAWVSVDERDNDPKVLLTYIAEALDAIEPVGGRLFDALASPGSSVPGSVVPRLGSAFASMAAPVVLVLDDVHLLDNTECRDALSVLADHVPAGSRLVLAGRNEPPLRVARLRAEGRILEIGPPDLSLTCAESAALLRGAGLELDTDVVAELHRRTEGWPVGLYLAALYLREGGSLPGAAVSFAGDDRLVSEYVESELMARISQRQRVFLTRTAVLGRMSGSLCETVLDLPGSAAVLDELARSNLLLVPLDRQGQWYRYHHLFRDMLLAELRRQEPALVPVLHQRAAQWFERNGLPEESLEHSMAGADVDMTARLVERLWLMAYRQARVTTVERWLRWLEDRGGMEKYPMIAVLAWFLAMQMGRSAEAERWADVVDCWPYRDEEARSGDRHARAWAALLRALSCRQGIEQMRADADEAARRFAEEHIVESAPALLQGLARVLSGDLDGGDACFEAVLGAREETSTPETVAVALGERSLLAMARGQWSRAEALAEQAGAVLLRAKFEGVLAYAVQARAAVHRGDFPAARQHLVNAQRVRPTLTYAIPHLAVQARIELARVHLELADIAGAKTLMRETDELLRRRPALGNLADEAQALRARLARMHGSTVPGASALTAAELRVLPMLATHLSFPEIGAEMFLSPNTVKSQAMSIYRKLEASSRSQAVARSRELGLLEG
jgi:LuxR family transcriptional regulator, maltose regulon positive regulatory protein